MSAAAGEPDRAGEPMPAAGTSDATSGKRNPGLDLLRIVAICGVVSIHIFGVILGADQLKGSLNWWAAAVANVGMTWVVPVFVMISGALTMSPRAHRHGPKAFYLARARRIVPAMIFWHLFYFVVVRALMRGESLTPQSIVLALIDADAYTGLYFLWVICGLYVIAPVFVAFFRDGGRRRELATATTVLVWGMGSVVVAGVASIIGAPRPIHFGALNSWLYYVGFFLMGWALRDVRLRGKGLVAVVVLASALLAQLVWQFGTIPDYPVLQTLLRVSRLGVVAGLAAVAIFVIGNSVGSLVRTSPRLSSALRTLSDASFGVFLVHLFVFAVLQELFPSVKEGLSMKAITGAYVVVVVVSFAISIVARRLPLVRSVF